MTKKAIKTVDRQLAKVENRYNKEVAALADDDFLVDSCAVLAQSISNLFMAVKGEVPENITLALAEMKRRSLRLDKFRDHRDTLCAAIKSGRFANLDAEW